MLTPNGIKMLLLTVFVLIFFMNKVHAQAKAMGEPVPGAEIYIELETDDQPLMKGKTDHIGTYHFKNIKSGKYKIVCKLTETIDSIAKKVELTKAKKLHVNFIVEGMQKGPITFGSKTGKNPLLFESPELLLKEKANALVVTVVISGNNYGINDEGIK